MIPMEMMIVSIMRIETILSLRADRWVRSNNKEMEFNFYHVVIHHDYKDNNISDDDDYIDHGSTNENDNSYEDRDNIANKSRYENKK